MPMDVVIRPARADEAETVLALWREANAVESVTDDASSVRELIGRDPGSLLVAEMDGRVVGTLVATWDGWRGHFYRLAVRPDVRHRGVATDLVREGERRLRNLGARRLSALVMKESEEAAGFWRAAGYEHDQRVRRFIRTME